MIELTAHKTMMTGLVILALLAACAGGTPKPNYTSTATNTPPLITPTITPTPLPTSTPTPALQKYTINLFFDKNLSGEMDYEGEIPLEGVDLEARIGEDVFSCSSDAQGDCALQLPIGFSGESLEVRLPNKVHNPQNNHELKIAVLNFGQETVQIPAELIGKFGMTAYIRNKIDLFKTSLPFMIPLKASNTIGLSHGEVTYWIPEYDLDKTCIMTYYDLDYKYSSVLNFQGDTRMSSLYAGPVPPDLCATQYGTSDQHAGIDTRYLQGSPRLLISPVLGVVTIRTEQDRIDIATKFGGIVYIGHMNA